MKHNFIEFYKALATATMFLTSFMRVLLTKSTRPFLFKNTYHNDLEYKNLEDLGLYVHIPFCRSLCSFCPYCKEKYDKKLADDYKKALLKEIDLVGAQSNTKKSVTSLYFGGGTPALMLEDLQEIILKIQEYFEIAGGIGVELHPKDITEATLEQLKAAGVTMVSLGIQSFDQNCLSKIGRSYDNFIAKLQLVKSFKFDVVDVDLIFAIPGQTNKSLQNDIVTAFKNGATQISTYPFIDFTFANNRYKPMSEKTKKEMLKNLTYFCEKIGVKRTSVWTFAKPNTNKYSSVTRDTFLGFGVSATTLLKDEFKINTFSIPEYINRVNSSQLPTSLTLNFTKRQRAVYYLFWSAYGMRIHPEKFEKIIGTSLDKMFGAEFFLLEKLGFIKKQQKGYVLTNQSAYIYHYIEQVYTTAYIDKMWNVSRKIPFPNEIILK